ncbi:MAG: hypothetical protein NZ610_05225 [Candidatus Bipolaricaulota bacterium]|nr:hypothetical protein [Candidatus Bipolaricaulota bacterium]
MKWIYHSLGLVSAVALVLLASNLASSSLEESWLLQTQGCSWLQAAIDAAPPGATLRIPEGVCVGNWIVKKSLRLEGRGTEATFLEPTLNFRNSQGLNPVITLQSSPNQDITLELVNLAIRQPPQPYQVPFNYGSFDKAVGVQVEGPDGSVSLVAHRTYWTRLNNDIYSKPLLRRLEIRESTFERNFWLHVKALEVEIRGNLYLENNTVLVGGQQLRVLNNTVIAKYHSSAIILRPEGEGRAEVFGNVVVASGGGLSLDQPDRQRVQFIVRNNRLINNQVGIYISGLDTRNTYFDITIEENKIAQSNVGIFMAFDAFRAGENLRGAIRLRRNHITTSSLDYVHGIGRLPWYGNGVHISIFGTVAWPEEDPLTIELTENRIDYNEKYGIAINDGWEIDSPDICVVYGEVDGRPILPPKIVGSGNIIRENEKGDLCPPDYPWPSGFRK